jgi:hypothetical protein
MRKWIICILVGMLLFVQGCAALDGLLLNSDGNVKDDIKNVTEAGEGIGAVLGNFHPVGYIVSGISVIVSGVLGGYAEMRRKQANASQDSLTQTKLVLQSVVRTIEENANVKVTKDKTIGDILKPIVQEKLTNEELLEFGKYLISVLKNA